VAYERGLHVFEITWSTRQRGTHAVVGVATGLSSKNVLDKSLLKILFLVFVLNFFVLCSHLRLFKKIDLDFT